jgi:hypothetical protein
MKRYLEQYQKDWGLDQAEIDVLIALVKHSDECCNPNSLNQHKSFSLKAIPERLLPGIHKMIQRGLDFEQNVNEYNKTQINNPTQMEPRNIHTRYLSIKGGRLHFNLLVLSLIIDSWYKARAVVSSPNPISQPE